MTNLRATTSIEPSDYYQQVLDQTHEIRMLLNAFSRRTDEAYHLEILPDLIKAAHEEIFWCQATVEGLKHKVEQENQKQQPNQEILVKLNSELSGSERKLSEQQQIVGSLNDLFVRQTSKLKPYRDKIQKLFVNLDSYVQALTDLPPSQKATFSSPNSFEQFNVILNLMYEFAEDLRKLYQNEAKNYKNKDEVTPLEWHILNQKFNPDKDPKISKDILLDMVKRRIEYIDTTHNLETLPEKPSFIQEEYYGLKNDIDFRPLRISTFRKKKTSEKIEQASEKKETSEREKQVSEQKETSEGEKQVSEQKETSERVKQVSEQKETSERVKQVSEQKETSEREKQVSEQKETSERVKQVSEQKENSERVKQVSEQKETSEKMSQKSDKSRSFLSRIATAVGNFFKKFFSTQRFVPGPTMVPPITEPVIKKDLNTVAREDIDTTAREKLPSQFPFLQKESNKITILFANVTDMLAMVNIVSRRLKDGTITLPDAVEVKKTSKTDIVSKRLETLFDEIKNLEEQINHCKKDADVNTELLKQRDQLLVQIQTLSKDIEIINPKSEYLGIYENGNCIKHSENFFKLDEKSFNDDHLSLFQRLFLRIRSESNYHPTTAIVDKRLDITSLTFAEEIRPENVVGSAPKQKDTAPVIGPTLGGKTEISSPNLSRKSFK